MMNFKWIFDFEISVDENQKIPTIRSGKANKAGQAFQQSLLYYPTLVVSDLIPGLLALQL